MNIPCEQLFLFTVATFILSGVNVCYAQSPDDAAAQASFYNSNEVQTIHLHVVEEELQRMLAALPKRVYVPATFRCNDITIKNVGVRYKGNSSAAPKQKHKRSFLIKFDEFEKEHRFVGLQRVSLDNGIQFGSLFSEQIVTDILRELNVPTHRCNFARLMLNEKFHGVYVNVERIDQTFTKNHLPDPDGALFKVDEGGPAANLQFIGDDPAAYQKAFEPKNKVAEESGDLLVDLIRSINRAEPENVRELLESNMDVDRFLHTTAVMLLSGAFDQLTGWNPHNYYLYRNGKDKRWHYLPWDLDVGFSETAFGRLNILDDWNAAWPIPTTGAPNPLLERMIADPLLLSRYRTIASEVLEKQFEPERLCAIIDRRYELIRDDLKKDPFPHRRVTTPGNESYDDIVASMKQFARKRYASARAQLADPGERPKFVGRHRGVGGAPPHIAKKVRSVEQQVHAMHSRLQQKMKAIHARMEQVGPLIQSGKTAEAEKLLDEALDLIGEGG